MRVWGPLALASLGLVAGVGALASARAPAPSSQPPATSFQPPADAILSATRQALGGDARIAAVKTFVATGRTRQVRGDNLVPIEFEITCELPDRYLRRDEVPAQGSGPTSAGFNGEQLILLPPPSPPLPDPARLARLTAARQDFARLMLGMFAGSSSALQLTFAVMGQAESPQGKADVLAVKGPANFDARLFVYSDTHLPIMVTWQAPPNENRLYFADYQIVDGLRLPFRLRRAVGADTVEETTFDRFRINVKIDARKFDTR